MKSGHNRRGFSGVAKPKPGQIVIVPEDERLMESAPYINSMINLPSWFKSSGKHKGSIRKCAGTQDLLTMGVTIPMWTNVHFRPSPIGLGWEFAMGDFATEPVKFVNNPFPYESTGSCPMTNVRKIENSEYPKLVNPWCFITAPGWSSMILPIPYEPNEHYEVLPAVVHTDFYHNVNIVLNLKNDQPFTIKWNTPVARIIPFKREPELTEIIFEKEESFKLVTGRGFGSGFIMPIGHIVGDRSDAGKAYRQEKAKMDECVRGSEEQESRGWKALFRKK